MTAREYLTQLQLAEFGNSPPVSYDSRVRAEYLKTMAAADPEYRRVMEENLRKRTAFEARYADQVPTPYQSLQDYVRLLQAKSGIDDTLRSVGEYKPVDNMVMGSIETEQLNALSMYWPDSSEHLIVFNRGLLMAVLAVSNFVICSLSRNPALAAAGPTSTEPIDIIDPNIVATLAPNFRRILDRVTEGHAPELKSVVPLMKWQEKEIRWTKLEDAATEFAFAHEYAHILRGHTSPFRGDLMPNVHGEWGDEYEADSLGLDFLVQTWLARLGEANPVMIAFALQGVCLFLNLACYIERYSAEVRGSSGMLVSTSVSHPFTYLRWLRMIDKVRTKTREQWWKVAVVPQLLTVERCLAMYYQAAVGTVQARTPAAVEWRLQREALETLARYRLVPPHLFVAMRCARVAVSSGRIPNAEEVVAYAEQADRELETVGARQLCDYRSPLAGVAGAISQRALEDVQTLGIETVTAIVDRLADAFLLDARTRYPAPTLQNKLS